MPPRRAPISLLLILGAGCAMTVRPPADPKDPVVVILVDYGKHSSLILPDAAGGSVEYAYGEWDYFARGQDDLCTGMVALCCPNQGTLGRRSFGAPPSVESLRGPVGGEELLAVTVAKGNADALRTRLEERYERHPETRLFNPQYGLTFVQDDEGYICFNNCNHVVARWLEELGCEVCGCRWFSDFRLEPPRAGSASPEKNAEDPQIESHHGGARGPERGGPGADQAHRDNP